MYFIALVARSCGVGVNKRARTIAEWESVAAEWDNLSGNFIREWE